MKTPQEIKELLEQVKLEGHLRRTPTDFVLLEVLLNINARLAAVQAGGQTPAPNLAGNRNGQPAPGRRGSPRSNRFPAGSRRESQGKR